MVSFKEFQKPGLKVEFKTTGDFGGKVVRGQVLSNTYGDYETVMKVRLDSGKEMYILAGTVEWMKVAQNLKEKIAEVPVINKVKFTYSVEGFYIDTPSGVYFLGEYAVAKKFEDKGNIVKGVIDRAISRPGEWVSNQNL